MTKLLTLFLLVPIFTNAQQKDTSTHKEKPIQFEASFVFGSGGSALWAYDGNTSFNNTTQHQPEARIAIAAKAGIVYRNWQASFRMASQQIFMTATQTVEIINYQNLPTLYRDMYIKYAFARPLTSYTLEINRLFKTGAGRIAYGASLGYAKTKPDSLILIDQSGYRYPKVYSIPATKGITAGLQLGYTYFPIHHIGVAINTGIYYYYGSKNGHSASFLYYPILIGVTGRL